MSILDRYGRSLGDQLRSYILQFADVHDPAYFKILPKVHKCPLVGRPIVASIKYLTTHAKDVRNAQEEANTTKNVTKL